MAEKEDPRRRRFSLELSVDLLDKIDGLKAELGLRSRGDLVERLLGDLFRSDDDGADSLDDSASADPDQDSAAHSPDTFNEQGALVLVTRGVGGTLTLDLEDSDIDWAEAGRATMPPPRSSGIDLPGFVRRQSDQLKRSLHPRRPDVQATVEPLPQVGGELIAQALMRARTHWVELYGNDANDAVLEAAMVWIAQDIWPQSDQSDNRPFTWSLACDVVATTAPSWGREPASFERVMVMAGLLEDPFSTSTLELRLPTLIRRFVHRFRKRRKGTSFQTLEHTMTLHGALKLLNLPTAPGHRLTLGQIRDAYRDLAMSNHPDAGGSEDSMRRLNEAYQLLKELYRNQ
ncbi:MAG: hypothetical protein RLZZ268_1500 [Cyanobacteriota bacterium]|jgi:hypothetical protein